MHGVPALWITKWHPIFDRLDCVQFNLRRYLSRTNFWAKTLLPVDPCFYKTTTWGHAKKKARNIGKRKSRQQIFKPCHLQKLTRLLSCQHSKAICLYSTHFFSSVNSQTLATRSKNNFVPHIWKEFERYIKLLFPNWLFYQRIFV